jgi:hypothetical protein
LESAKKIFGENCIGEIRYRRNSSSAKKIFGENGLIPTFRDNFRGWWRTYHDDLLQRDMKWIEQTNPERVTVEKWMRQTGYDGTRKPLLKNVEDR